MNNGLVFFFIVSLSISVYFCCFITLLLLLLHLLFQSIIRLSSGKTHKENSINLCVFVCVMINRNEYLTERSNEESVFFTYGLVREKCCFTSFFLSWWNWLASFAFDAPEVVALSHQLSHSFLHAYTESKKFRTMANAHARLSSTESSENSERSLIFQPCILASTSCDLPCLQPLWLSKRADRSVCSV